MSRNARIHRQNRVYQCITTMHTGACNYLAMALVHVASFIGIWSCTAVPLFRHTLRVSRTSRKHRILTESQTPCYVCKCKWANVGRTELSYLHRRLRFSSADISRIFDLQIETHHCAFPKRKTLKIEETYECRLEIDITRRNALLSQVVL